MAKVVHTHKVKLRKLKNDEEVFFCVLNCKYRIHKDEALGKVVECWACGLPFAMNEYSIRRTKPKCPSCVGEHGDAIEDKTNKIKGKEIKAQSNRSPAAIAADELANSLKAIIGESIDPGLSEDPDDFL